MSIPRLSDFEEWLEGMHPRLARFRDFLLPIGMSRDFSRRSLVELERLMLDRWPDKSAFLADPDTDFTDGAVRYIGESYLRAFGGGWKYTDDPKTPLAGRPFLRLDLPIAVPITPFFLITALLGRRTGHELEAVYDGQTREVADQRGAAASGRRPAREPVLGVTPGAGARGRKDPARDLWVAGLQERLDALRADVGKAGGPLDLSPTSLPVLEQQVLQQVPDTESLWSATNSRRFEQYVSYLGEVLRGQAGGDWEVQPGTATVGNSRFGRPYLTRLDRDGDDIVSRPYGTVVALVMRRTAGTFARALGHYCD